MTKKTPGVNLPAAPIKTRATFMDALMHAGCLHEAYRVYLIRKCNQDVLDFLATVPNYPANKIPKTVNSVSNLINQIIKACADPADSQYQDEGFAALLEGLDKILSMDAGSIGAMYQNMIKACLRKIVKLENSPAIDPKMNPEANIIKYIEQIRFLMGEVQKAYNDQQQVAKQIREAANAESKIVLNAVREVVHDLCPELVNDFGKLLLAKLDKTVDMQNFHGSNPSKTA